MSKLGDHRKGRHGGGNTRCGYPWRTKRTAKSLFFHLRFRRRCCFCGPLSQLASQKVRLAMGGIPGAPVAFTPDLQKPRQRLMKIKRRELS